MRKNLTRIASLVLACVLFSVPAFAALTGSYSDGTFTVSGGETGLQTSLIIVSGNHATLPVDVENEAVTGAIYIDQVEAGAEGAVFAGVALTNAEVHTAFFSNESENSASSFKIVNATLSIAADSTTVEEDQQVLVSVQKPASAGDAPVSFKVNGEAATLEAVTGGYAFVPEEAGDYTIVATVTVAGQTITSNAITITATEAAVVLDPEVIEGDDTILGLVKSPTSTYAASPVGIKVTFDGEKIIYKMKWVFEADGTYYYSATLPVNLTVSGAAAFAAVVVNGDVVDGEIVNAVEIDKVGAIFDVEGQDFYTNEAYGAQKVAAN